MGSGGMGVPPGPDLRQGRGSAGRQRTVCSHKEVMKDLCVQCGQDIRKLTDEDRRSILQSASISMIHSVPELRISKVSLKLMPLSLNA